LDRFINFVSHLWENSFSKGPRRLLKDQSGFTLSELLIAMVVSGMVVGGTTMVFRTMVKGHNTEVRTLTMQQNLRATMNYLERYIRMGGFDPTGAAGAEFTTLLSNNIAFTRDKGKPVGTAIDNDPNGTIDNHWDEMIEFRFNAGNSAIERLQASGTPVTLAEDIEALNFVYLDADRLPTNNTSEVRTVQVAIVARFGDEAGYTSQQRDTTDYRNQQGAVILPAPNDNIRRMMLTADVSCRNMGR